MTKLGFSQNVQFISKRQVSKNHTIYPIAYHLFFGPWVCLGLLSKKTQERGLLESPPQLESGPPVLLQAPQEEASFAHNLESNLMCDRPSHLALKIEGTLSPAFSLFTCSRYSLTSQRLFFVAKVEGGILLGDL